MFFVALAPLCGRKRRFVVEAPLCSRKRLMAERRHRWVAVGGFGRRERRFRYGGPCLLLLPESMKAAPSQGSAARAFEHVHEGIAPMAMELSHPPLVSSGTEKVSKARASVSSCPCAALAVFVAQWGLSVLLDDASLPHPQSTVVATSCASWPGSCTRRLRLLPRSLVEDFVPVQHWGVVSARTLHLDAVSPAGQHCTSFSRCPTVHLLMPRNRVEPRA